MEKRQYQPVCRCGWTGETTSDDPSLIISSYQSHLNKQEIKTWLPGGTSIIDMVYIDTNKKEHTLIPKVVSTTTLRENNLSHNP